MCGKLDIELDAQRRRSMKPEHRGQEFSDFLDELGIRGEVEAQAKVEDREFR